MLKQKKSCTFKGSALIALPLLLGIAWPQLLRASFAYPSQTSQGSGSGNGLEANWTLLSVNPGPLNAASAQAGFPGTSASTMQLWGGGSVVQTGVTRYGVIGMTGGLASSDGASYSNWNLDLAGLTVEQRYSGSSVEMLAGLFVGVGQFGIDYRDGTNLTQFNSRFIGTGATAGMHWPANSRLSFVLRTGYLWLPASGSWQGSVAGKMSTTYFDLSAPFGQAAIDVSF